jgi:hypothetical protein
MPGGGTVVPAIIAGGTIGFAGGLLWGTLAEVAGVGQPLEDLSDKVISGLKGIVRNQVNTTK